MFDVSVLVVVTVSLPLRFLFFNTASACGAEPPDSNGTCLVLFSKRGVPDVTLSESLCLVTFVYQDRGLDVVVVVSLWVLVIFQDVDEGMGYLHVR